MRLQRQQAVLLYGSLVALLAITVLLGVCGASLVRPIFVIGCIGVAYYALRMGSHKHVEIAIALFTLAPFVRRVVDYHLGFDESGMMLVGPILALALVLPRLGTLLQRRSSLSSLLPQSTVLVCIIYGWMLSAFQDNLVGAGIEAVKIIMPMLYALHVALSDEDHDKIIECAARAFLVITPIIAVYGILQYFDPPQWDRYWMMYAPIKSAGLPEPRQVRVFSTMNSPASFACFLLCGLMLLGFCSRGWAQVLLVVPVGAALLLTAVRTVWIAFGISIVLCLFFDATRRRATLLTLCMVGTTALAVLATPFGEAVGARMATLLGDPAQDGSGHERLIEILRVFSDPDAYLFGKGLGKGAPIEPKMFGVDGQLVTSTIAMGIFVGMIHVSAMIWSAAQSLMTIRAHEQPLRVVAAALLVGFLLVFPLLAFSFGEIAFLFWLLVGVLAAAPVRSRNAAMTLSAPGRRVPSSGPFRSPAVPMPRR